MRRRLLLLLLVAAHVHSVWSVAHSVVHSRLLVPDADAVCIRMSRRVERLLGRKLGISVIRARSVVLMSELLVALESAVRSLEIGSTPYVVAVLHGARSWTRYWHLAVGRVELRLVVSGVVVVSEGGLEGSGSGVGVMRALLAMVMGELLSGVVGVVGVVVGGIRGLVLRGACGVGEGGVGGLLLLVLLVLLGLRRRGLLRLLLVCGGGVLELVVLCRGWWLLVVSRGDRGGCAGFLTWHAAADCALCVRWAMCMLCGYAIGECVCV